MKMQKAFEQMAQILQIGSGISYKNGRIFGGKK